MEASMRLTDAHPWQMHPHHIELLASIWDDLNLRPYLHKVDVGNCQANDRFIWPATFNQILEVIVSACLHLRRFKDVTAL